MDKIELAGFTAEQAESIREAARIYAERTTFTAEEATEKILGALNFISGEIREAFDKLTAVFRELAEELEPIDIEPRVRRRKRNRARAKIIEQQYRAESGGRKIHEFIGGYISRPKAERRKRT